MENGGPREDVESMKESESMEDGESMEDSVPGNRVHLGGKTTISSLRTPDRHPVNT